MGGARVRERSVDSLIKEVKDHIAKYKSEWVDFRQPVMASSKNWTVEFFGKYKEEIGLPFRCFTHPYLVNEPAIQALRDAGCFAVQMGVECWDEEVRNVIVNRSESNEDIKNACRIFEKVGTALCPRLHFRPTSGACKTTRWIHQAHDSGGDVGVL